MQQVSFSTNWNNKLILDVFPTFRLWNPAKYVVGNSYQITLGKHSLGEAKLIEATPFAYPYFEDRNHTVIEGKTYHYIKKLHALVDTGKPLPYLLKLFRNFYPNSNWQTQLLGWYFFEYTQPSKYQQTLKAKHPIAFTPDLFYNEPAQVIPDLNSAQTPQL